ncbi:putative mediator of RNA polymerase II transcription subunit 15a-like isoform X2 [Capsicum annuum]|nr:putative mediator of RNA polymerase II transcription subunit 15a-like isoform X2 [Capsicum annuum]
MDEAHPLNTPMVVQSLDVTQDPFRRQEKQERILGSEVPYLSAIGVLMYLANSTRPDIVFFVNLSVRRDTLIWHVRVYTRVYTQELGHELMRIAVMFEEKVYTAATSLQDYLQRICLKMRTIDIRSQNRVINPLLPNAASSGPNAHGPEAVSYETISGPVVSDEDEDAEDVSKEDSLEEVAMTKERKSAVGHKENVKVGENELRWRACPYLHPSGGEPLDSTSQTGNANGADWQEEAYQKIKSMREMYLSELFTVKLLLKCRSLQHQESQGANGNKYISFEHKSDMDNGRNASSADHENSTSQMGNADGADWYEEIYLKIKTLRDKHLIQRSLIYTRESPLQCSWYVINLLFPLLLLLEEILPAVQCSMLNLLDFDIV